MARPRKHAPITKFCAHCGKPWLAESVYEIEKQATCSLACRNANTTATRTNKIDWKCACGTVLQLTPYWAAKRKHCSYECSSAAKPGCGAGPSNNAWDGGSPVYWKRQARIRDGFTCRFPGCGLHDEGKKTHAHHKIPRAVGGSDDLDNLITLCATHHKHLEALVMLALMKSHPDLVRAASIEAYADLLPVPDDVS